MEGGYNGLWEGEEKRRKSLLLRGFCGKGEKNDDRNEARPGGKDQWQARLAVVGTREDNYGMGQAGSGRLGALGPMGRVRSPAGISSALRVNGGLVSAPTAPLSSDI